MPFIGNQPALAYTSLAKQDFTTSATTSYVLDNPVANANEIALFINFVRQEPTTAYTASGTSLTLTSATSASDDMYAIFLGKAVQTVNPPVGSVGTSQLADASITSAKLASGVGGKVLQVVSATTSSATSTTSTSFVATNLSVSITPSSASNKILIISHGSGSATSGNESYITLYRDATNLGNATYGMINWGSSTASMAEGFGLTYLDSPSTTSAINYKYYFKVSGGGTGYFNLNSQISSITAMEIAV
jgi:hypothetical protein